MSFSFAYPGWLLALALVAAGGLTYGTYRNTVPALSPPRRALLAGCRFLALALICLLLFQPVAQQVEERERPPLLAVLIDDSESLRVTATQAAGAAGRPPADDGLRSAVGAVTDALQTGDLSGEQRAFALADGARAVGTLGEDAPLDSLSFTGPRTNIAAALQQVRDALQDENLQGVALVSDGRYNAGRNPLYVAERFPVPIHTVTVGDTTRQRDVQVRRVTTNDIAYVDTELPVQVGLRSEDAGGETVSVRLRSGGETLDAQDVRLPSGTAEVPVDLAVTPDEAGLQRLTVEVSGVSGEATARNNRRSVSVRVLESKRSVLVLAAAPSPTFAAVRRVLEQNANTEVTARTPRPGGRFLEGPLPEDLSAFDVIVCAGFPSEAVPGSVVDRVATAAENGRPTVFFLDRQTDLTAWRDAFGSVLPVTVDDLRPGFTDAAFRPAPDRRQHPVFDIDGASIDLFNRLPPLETSDTRFQAPPDATVLARSTVRDVALNDPLLVLRSRAGQRSAALLGTRTWRWANLPSDLASADPLWPGLVSNLVRWAAVRQDDRPVRVRPVESTFGGGERVEFTGQVYDESLTPVDDASVEVTVTAPDSTQYPYTMEPVGNGRYVLDVGMLPEGTYTYRAAAEQGGASLGTDRGQFSVGPLTLEYRETTADAAFMRQIAARSGGTALSTDQIGDLPNRIAASGTFTPQVVTETREAELWRASAFLAAILALLAAEWTLRKRFGLV